MIRNTCRRISIVIVFFGLVILWLDGVGWQLVLGAGVMLLILAVGLTGSRRRMLGRGLGCCR